MFHYLAILLVGGSLLMPISARAELCSPGDPNLLMPDLKALSPSQLRVLPWGAGRRLFFTTSIGNIGDGPLLLRGETGQGPNGSYTKAWQRIERRDGSVCEVAAGEFELHPLHLHWHLRDFADYVLRKDDPFTGEIVAQSGKVSFCLLDSVRVPGAPVAGRQRFITACTSQEGLQGISPGFADVYDSTLPGQYIDLDADPQNPVPPGNYFLVNIANPAKILWEKNNSSAANAGVVSVSIPTPRGYTPRATMTRTAVPTPSMLPTPSASATVRASVTPTPRRPRPPKPMRPVRAPRPVRPGGPHAR